MLGMALSFGEDESKQFALAHEMATMVILCAFYVALAFIEDYMHTTTTRRIFIKKFFCIALALSLLFPMVTPAFAANSASPDTASYIDSETGDIISLEVVTLSSPGTARTSQSSNIYSTRISRNGILEEILHVDFSRDILQHEYPDGTIRTEVLSDIVTVTKVAPSTDDQTLEAFSSVIDEGVTRATDYVDSEPFELWDSGAQKALSGATYYSGYQAMGYRGGYIYAPTTYGYLQRKNAGVVETYSSHRFEFTAGTTVSTAASIIVSFFTGNGIALALSIVTALLLAVVSTVIDSWGAVFEVRCYKWLYRVRLNSNTGEIIYTTYRTRDYLKSYNPATGAVAYEYRGTRYDDGFVLSNSEMINFALDAYFESLS